MSRREIIPSGADVGQLAPDECAPHLTITLTVILNP